MLRAGWPWWMFSATPRRRLSMIQVMITLLNYDDESNFDVNLILPESFHCEMYLEYTSSPTPIINLSISKMFNNHILFSYLVLAVICNFLF